MGRIRSNFFFVVFHLPSDPLLMIMTSSEGAPFRFLSGGGDSRGGLEGLSRSLLLGSGRSGGRGLSLGGLGSLLGGRLSLGLGLGGGDGGDSRGLLGLLLSLLGLLGLALALRVMSVSHTAGLIQIDADIP
jgi:hypothetical protein